MTRQELQDLHAKMCQEARETQTRKNHDYASESDIFRNFRYFGGLGILVRMSDKLARLRSFEENGVFKVEDEKLADTVQDLINYAIIYYAYKQPESTTIVGVPAIPNGPYCDHCEKLAEFRLDENNCDTRYFCHQHTVFLGHADYANCTRMEKL